MSASWLESAQTFFDERAAAISKRPSLADLCFVSGRDPRLWSDEALLDDLAGSIIGQTNSSASTSMLEVGCAAGFIAQLVAPRVRQYAGVDMSDQAIRAARRLGLPNAEFRRVSPHALPFEDSRFDAVVCYDVITNFPSVDEAGALVAEMLRVVKPGGAVLVGSVPDRSKQALFEQRVAEVSRDLEQRFGPPPPPPSAAAPGLLSRLMRRARTAPAADPAIVCYYFDRDGFSALGARLGAAPEFLDIQGRNPYFGLRFNVKFVKPQN